VGWYRATSVVLGLLMCKRDFFFRTVLLGVNRKKEKTKKKKKKEKENSCRERHWTEIVSA
jgi:hypothetical protein